MIEPHVTLKVGDWAVIKETGEMVTVLELDLDVLGILFSDGSVHVGQATELEPLVKSSGLSVKPGRKVKVIPHNDSYFYHRYFGQTGTYLGVDVLTDNNGLERWLPEAKLKKIRPITPKAPRVEVIDG